MTPARRTILWTLLAGGLVAASLLAAGCNIVAPLVYAFSPPAKKAPEYYLIDRPTVVYVDDRRNLLTYRGLRRRISDIVAGSLVQHEVLSPDNAISGRDAIAIVDQNDRHSQPMPIDSIGAAVGAEQIIYIEITQAIQSVDGYTAQPGGSCTVRVIDVANRERLFPIYDNPDAPAAYTVRVLGRRVSVPPGSRGASALQSFEMLAADMGDEIAKVFYEHVIEDLGQKLQNR